MNKIFLSLSALSRIVKLGYQDNPKSVFFFFTKKIKPKYPTNILQTQISCKYCFIIAVSNTEISKTNYFLNKIFLSLSALSRIVKLGYQDNPKPFFFFLYKKNQTQIKPITLIKVLLCTKKCCFCSLNFILLVGFGLNCIFVCAKSFCKKINWFGVVLITSFYYTTGVYPYQPTYWGFACMHLFLFVIICENLFFLWESFWILICDHLWESNFVSLYENKLVYEFHHLKHIIMIFCWFRMFQVYVFYFEFFSFCVWVLFC